MNNDDIKTLYNAFVKLCDYIEMETKDSCESCPLNAKCFGRNGSYGFVEAIKRIEKEVIWDMNIETE